MLDLVYNPNGIFLAPPQAKLQVRAELILQQPAAATLAVVPCRYHVCVAGRQKPFVLATSIQPVCRLCLEAIHRPRMAIKAAYTYRLDGPSHIFHGWRVAGDDIRP